MKTLKIFFSVFTMVVTLLFLAIMVEDAIIGDMLYSNSISMEYYQDAPEGSVADEAFNSAAVERENLEAMKAEPADGAIPGWFAKQDATIQLVVLVVCIIASAFSVAYLHGRWVVFTRTLKKEATTRRGVIARLFFVIFHLQNHLDFFLQLQFLSFFLLFVLLYFALILYLDFLNLFELILVPC